MSWYARRNVIREGKSTSEGSNFHFYTIATGPVEYIQSLILNPCNLSAILSVMMPIIQHRSLELHPRDGAPDPFACSQIQTSSRREEVKDSQGRSTHPTQNRNFP